MGGVISNWQAANNQNATAAAEYANALVSRWQAGDALVRGESAAGEMKLRGAQIGATGTVAAAHGSIDTQTGAPLKVRETTAGFTQLDVERIKNNALRAAFGYKTQAANHFAASDAARESAKWSMVAAGVSGVTSMAAMGSAIGPGEAGGTVAAGNYDAMPVIGSGAAPSLNPNYGPMIPPG